MNKDNFANQINRPETTGITFFTATNLALFLATIVREGLTYEVSQNTLDNDNDEFWVVTLTGGF